MFVQVIQGHAPDAARVRDQLDRWARDLAPGATGWLGSTAGVTEDGTLVALARFESEEAARRNSDRPEQTAWWEETASLFTDEPVFHDSTEVDVDVAGEPDRAGFVQVMQGRTRDPERARQLMADDPTDWREYRPDVLGSLTATHAGGEWTMFLYFSSEDAAREGEQKEPPAETQRLMKELDNLSVGGTAFFDLRDPWLHSPG
jgi:hypothetical protein